jgi:LPS sulfotransferase NodH
MPHFTSYILCATPRSGTTLLCDLLEATGVAGRPNSYFRRQNISDWAREWGIPRGDFADAEGFERAYLAAARRIGTDATPTFGLRLMWGSAVEFFAQLGRLYPELPDDPARLQQAFGPTLYVHVSRQDKVAQAVSRLRAEQGGLWHRAADGSDRERSSASQPVAYDGAGLASFLAEAEAEDAAWNVWFDRYGIAPLRLTYEGLSADPQATVAQILAALGQDPAIAATVMPRTAKLADATSLEWAARFRREGRRPLD